MARIYLADLVYDTCASNYTVPLNIGYLAAKLRSRFGASLEISLFKYPALLEKALKESPPDILALSNYSWNSRLSSLFLEIAREASPSCATVMGGPDIRVAPDDVSSFLKRRPALDYYVMSEGEEPFAELVDFILNKGGGLPEGVATLAEGALDYSPRKKAEGRELLLPSPYLAGFMDPFLADKAFIPLLETNRGCPFECVYCAWGGNASSSVRSRDLETVLAEIDYIAERSAGHPCWIVCDANFGILERDIAIAERIREAMDKKGFPIRVIAWQAKNGGERGRRISSILKDAFGYIAIQSADPLVLENSGRGKISLKRIENEVLRYKASGIEVNTDLLLGLPGESAQSHFNSICAAFDMGFDLIQPYNIRLLQGSAYETDLYREKYGVRTKFRPIFAAYGTYGGRRVFEIEESVRSTKDMSEGELDGFKVLHWLLYFAWNQGFLKPLLSYAQKLKINPAEVLLALAKTSHPLLRGLFREMKSLSESEWFGAAEEMERHYGVEGNFKWMTEHFVKLNNLYTAMALRKAGLIEAMRKAVAKIMLEKAMESNANICDATLEGLLDCSGKIVCDDFWRPAFSERHSCSGAVAAILFGKPELAALASIDYEASRPQEHCELVAHYLKKDANGNVSLQDLSAFLEMGGSRTVKNKLRPLP